MYYINLRQIGISLTTQVVHFMYKKGLVGHIYKMVRYLSNEESALQRNDQPV